MTALINKLSSALSTTILFAATVAMAGLGFAFMGVLALFALMAVGLAMITAPFVTRPQPAPAVADAVV